MSSEGVSENTEFGDSAVTGKRSTTCFTALPIGIFDDLKCIYRLKYRKYKKNAQEQIGFIFDVYV